MPVDMQEIFMKYPWEERKKLYQKDGLHPNKLGAELIAETDWKKYYTNGDQNVKKMNKKNMKNWDISSSKKIFF